MDSTTKTPNEAAQIVVAFDVPLGPSIFRFKKLKDAKAVHAKLIREMGRAWETKTNNIFSAKGDQYQIDLDLRHVMVVTLVDWNIFDKFVPRP